MNIKLSDIFEEILHESNPPNVSIMGRIWQTIGWQKKRLDLTQNHLILLHTSMDPRFHEWVQPNLEILRSIKPNETAAKPNETTNKIEQVKSNIKIKVISCPQHGACSSMELMLNVKFMGFQFVGTFNRNELESDPFKKRKVVYYPCEEEKKGGTPTNQNTDIIDSFLKEMSYAYLSKTNLGNCDENIFGLFNEKDSRFIAFVDFNDTPRDKSYFSKFIQ